METRVEDKKVRDLMTYGVVTIPEYSKVAGVVDVLVEGHVHGIVVTNKKSDMEGVISEIDITKACDKNFEEIKVIDIMSSPVKTIGIDESIRAAGEIMKNERINRLVVVDENKKMRGILSVTDIINEIYRIHRA